MISILLQQDRSAACRYHHARQLREEVDDFSLTLTKSRLALFLEDVRNIYACAPLDLYIAVIEAQVQQLGQLSAHSRFARAHGADEIDVLNFGHTNQKKTAASLRPLILNRMYSSAQSIQACTLTQNPRGHEDQQLILVVRLRG